MLLRLALRGSGVVRMSIISRIGGRVCGLDILLGSLGLRASLDGLEALTTSAHSIVGRLVALRLLNQLDDLFSVMKL